MTPEGPVLVVGATGNVGGAVVRSLLARGRSVRAAGSAPAELERLFPGAGAARLDLLDPSTFDPAVEGASALFLLRPPAISSVGPTLNALVDRATLAGVRHVVFSSVSGADTNRVVPHHRVETHLRASPTSWTILRPGFFAQNLADAYRADIVEDGRIYLPAGRGRAAFIDARDIGEVAAVVLADPASHAGAGYTLTGPEALSFDQVAAIVSRQLGRSVSYRPASVLGYARHLYRRAMPLVQVVVQTVLHTGLRWGQAETVDPTLERLLGRPGGTLEQYVHDHRATWAAAERIPRHVGDGSH
ncbi:MAG: NmrA family NAD(P)-binding protein [Nocardioides sp.]|nr:NmrA family NAD(P)-binding protein [Nocardioides sp.]